MSSADGEKRVHITHTLIRLFETSPLRSDPSQAKPSTTTHATLTCFPSLGPLLFLLLLLILFSLSLFGLTRIVSLAVLIRLCFSIDERFRRATGICSKQRQKKTKKKKKSQQVAHGRMIACNCFSSVVTFFSYAIPAQNMHILGIARVDESSCRGIESEPGPSAHSAEERGARDKKDKGKNKQARKEEKRRA